MQFSTTRNNNPSGLNFYGYLNAATLDCQTSTYLIDPSEPSIFKNDPVYLKSGSTTPITKTITATDNQSANAASSSPAALNGFSLTPNGTFIGSFQGCAWYDAQGNFKESPKWISGSDIGPWLGKGFWAGQRCAMAYVFDDPRIVYAVQLSSSTGSTIPYFGDMTGFFRIGKLVNTANSSLNNPASGTNGDFSVYYLDYSTLTNNIVSYPVQIVGLANMDGNILGANYPTVLVSTYFGLYKGEPSNKPL